MRIDITQIVIALIGLLSAVLTGFAIPWLKSKIDINNGKVSENQAYMIKLVINTAVKAAEQLYNSDEGKEKKAYVVNLLKEQGLDIDLPEIDAAIEAAVLELHRQINE